MSKKIRSGFKIAISDEAKKQFDIADEAIGKLADLSNRSWCLLEGRNYMRKLGGAAIVGGAITAAGIGLTKMVKNIRKNRKDKQEPESE